MGKIKAKKVATPGSLPVTPKRGRPQKKQKEKDRSRGSYRKGYNEEDMEKAMKLVKAKKMTIREASKEFKIPKATLCDKINAKCSSNMGRPTVLTREEEEVIVQRLILMGEWGFLLAPKDLRQGCTYILSTFYIQERGEKGGKI